MPFKHTPLKLFLAIALVTTLLCFGDNELFSIGTVLAQGGVNAPTESLLNGFSQTASVIATVLQFLAFLAFHFLQYLLDPQFILGITQDAGSGEAMLRGIWMFSRDIMNIIFAFLLLLLGVITVITHSRQFFDSYFVKFITAVILVNFSWFFPRVILDVANIMTATIYQLPSALQQSTGAPQCTYTTNGTSQPCQIIVDVQFFGKCAKVGNGYVHPIRNVVCYKTENLSPQANTAMGMLNGLVVNYGRLGDLTRVVKPPQNQGNNGPGADQLMNIVTLLMHLAFILVMMTMLTLPLISMLIIFVIRIPIIWLTIAFMPFMFLGYVIGDKMGNFNTFKILDTFVKAAFLPTAVAVPLSIGFILINAMYNSAPPTGAEALGQPTGPIIFGVDTFWQLLWMITSMLVIWTGFFMAVSGMGSIYEKAVAGIKSFGEDIGSTAVKLPLSVPFIPTGKGNEKISLLGVDDKVRQFKSGLSAGKGPFESAEDAGGKGGVSGQKLGEALNQPNTLTNKLLGDIAEELKAGGAKTGKEVNDANLPDIVRSRITEIKGKLKDNGISDADSLNADDIVDRIRRGTAANRDELIRRAK